MMGGSVSPTREVCNILHIDYSKPSLSDVLFHLHREAASTGPRNYFLRSASISFLHLRISSTLTAPSPRFRHPSNNGFSARCINRQASASSCEILAGIFTTPCLSACRRSPCSTRNPPIVTGPPASSTWIKPCETSMVEARTVIPSSYISSKSRMPPFVIVPEQPRARWVVACTSPQNEPTGCASISSITAMEGRGDSIKDW